MSTPANVAALIRQIRSVQPQISALGIEALLRIAAGDDCSAELQIHMGIDRPRAVRLVNQLTGRGSVGKTGRASNLRLVQRRKHPHRQGTQLSLTAEGVQLISSAFVLPS
jgi:DNA-binding MarR family transcriptional regulator